MPSDSSDHRRTTTKPHHINGCPPPDQPEHLQCPRCDSTNTKFCYYNNYNFSQPRHFCKACRRYWTHGGTLRDIPIGGGSRKNAKRSRLTAPTNVVEYRHMAPPIATPIMFPFIGEHVGGLHINNNNNNININNNILCYGKQCDSFTSLLNGGNGPGVFGVEDGGFGFGRGVWTFYGGGDGGCYGGGGGCYGGGGGNMWQMEGGEGLSLPELAITTPGMMI